MKLLLVNSAWPQSFGGGEKWFVNAADWFRRRGHDVVIVGRAHSILLQCARDLGIPAIEFGFGGDYDPFAVLKAKKLLKELKPNAILVNFNKEARLFGKAAKSFSIPVIARHGFPILKNTVRHKRLKEKLITKLIVNAESIKQQYRQFGFPAENVSVILNGVQLREQRPGELRKRFKIPENSPLIVAAGRLEPQKRLDRAIDVIATLNKKHENIRCLIFGQGPLNNELQSQINSLNLQSVITLGGFLNDFDAIIGDADIFLLTSDNEGTPNALLEAMAAAAPAVSFAIGSVPNILTGELSSFCIPNGDEALMTNRVEQLLNDADYRKTIGNKMKQQVIENFCFDRSMEHYEELIAETIVNHT